MSTRWQCGISVAQFAQFLILAMDIETKFQKWLYQLYRLPTFAPIWEVSRSECRRRDLLASHPQTLQFSTPANRKKKKKNCHSQDTQNFAAIMFEVEG